MENTSNMVYPFKDMAKDAKNESLTTKKWYRVFQVIRAVYLIAACLFGLLMLIVSFADGDVLAGILGTAVYAAVVYALDLGIVYAVRYIAVGK